MAGAFTVINLSQLPAPDAVEQIRYEDILSAMLADLRARDASFTALVESDPAYKILEVAAYREMLLRQRVNDAARAVMLAYASGADLDQLGANVNVARLTVTPADDTTVPPTPAVMETDDEFRARIQLSFEGYTTAGSEGSYVFHGLSADGDVKDIAAVSPAPGEVVVYVLSRTGNGAAPAPLLAKVAAAVNAERVRPLTDSVTVEAAEVVPYAVTAELVLYPGPDAAVVEAEARKALAEYVTAVARIGYDVAVSGIYQALHRVGVQRVNLTAPAANIAIADGQASYCTGVTLTLSEAVNV